MYAEEKDLQKSSTGYVRPFKAYRYPFVFFSRITPPTCNFLPHPLFYPLHPESITRSQQKLCGLVYRNNLRNPRLPKPKA